MWLMSTEIYDQLRKNAGCENLEDIKAAKKDVGFMKEAAQALGIKPENMFIDDQPNL